MALTILEPFTQAAKAKWEPELRRRARLAFFLFLVTLTTFLFFVGCERVVVSSTYSCRCINDTCTYAGQLVMKNETFVLDYTELGQNIGAQACEETLWDCPIRLQSGKKGSDLCPLVVLETDFALLTIIYGVSAVLCTFSYLSLFVLGKMNNRWMSTNPEAKKLLRTGKRPPV